MVIEIVCELASGSGGLLRALGADTITEKFCPFPG